MRGPPGCRDAPPARRARFCGRLTGPRPGPIVSCRSLSSQLPISAPRCGSPARWGSRRRGAPSGRRVVGASRGGGLSGHPTAAAAAPRPGPSPRGRGVGSARAGQPSGRGDDAGVGTTAGACVSLALRCSERPRLRRNRRRCVCKAKALRLEVGRAPGSGQSAAAATLRSS